MLVEPRTQALSRRGKSLATFGGSEQFTSSTSWFMWFTATTPYFCMWYAFLEKDREKQHSYKT